MPTHLFPRHVHWGKGVSRNLPFSKVLCLGKSSKKQRQTWWQKQSICAGKRWEEWCEWPKPTSTIKFWPSSCHRDSDRQWWMDPKRLDFSYLWWYWVTNTPNHSNIYRVYFILVSKIQSCTLYDDCCPAVYLALQQLCFVAVVLTSFHYSIV